MNIDGGDLLFRRLGLPFIDPGPFVDSHNKKNARFKGIEDTVIADPYPEDTRPTKELLCTPGPGIFRKIPDPCCQPVSKRLFCIHEEPLGLWTDPDLKRHDAPS